MPVLTKILLGVERVSACRLVRGKVLPMPESDGEVTRLLKAMGDGDPNAVERLLPLVYAELHRLARHYMRRERPGHTLQPTALINEAYIKLVRDPADWQSRTHFIGIAATMMRQILVDHARTHRAAIRGGNLERVDLDDGLLVSKERSDEVLALDEALSKLELVRPRQAKVVSLRYFAGLSFDEIASLLGIAPRTVKRDWALARVWLFRTIHGSSDGIEAEPEI